MSRIPTAVAIVSAPGDGGPAGATANAVASLSLDPPLMLACLDRGSRTLALIEAAGRFGISYLDGGGERLARAFATKDPHEEKWRDAPRLEREGVSIIEGALVWMACELRDLHEGGDHVIAIGGVIAVGSRDADPLLFWAGGYRPLGDVG